VLLAFFVSDAPHDKKVFDGNGPLSTFSSKIDLCYRLGLISKDEYRVMHVVRSIRNQFAHKLGGVAFSSQSIADRCKSISIPRRMITPKHIPFLGRGQDCAFAKNRKGIGE